MPDLGDLLGDGWTQASVDHNGACSPFLPIEEATPGYLQCVLDLVGANAQAAAG